MKDSEETVVQVGSSVSETHVITTVDVEVFAALTGDTNPVHLDDAYAAETRFGRRIAHGVLMAGYISAILGTRLPGPGSIYLRQSLTFKAPVYIGDAVTAVVTVEDVRDDRPIVTVRTECLNQAGTVVVTGEAVLLCEGMV